MKHFWYPCISVDKRRLPPVLPAPRQDPSAQRPSTRALLHPAWESHLFPDQWWCRRSLGLRQHGDGLISAAFLLHFILSSSYHFHLISSNLNLWLPQRPLSLCLSQAGARASWDFFMKRVWLIAAADCTDLSASLQRGWMGIWRFAVLHHPHVFCFYLIIFSKLAFCELAELLSTLGDVWAQNRPAKPPHAG